VQIRLAKISDERHALEIERAGGASERVELETRSTLQHDFLHYAVEAEAGLDGGFWGSLARGATLERLNDRMQTPMSPELAEIEQVVGALHGGTKGQSAVQLIAGMRRFAQALGQGLPAWLSETMLAGALERLRQVQGRWRATPYGGTLELDWPAAVSSTSLRTGA